MSLESVINPNRANPPRDCPILFGLAMGGTGLAFALPHVACLGGGATKGVSEATGMDLFKTEYVIPIIAGSAAYRGLGRGIVAAHFHDKKPITEGAKAAGIGALLFPLEFGAGYVFGYVAGKIFY